MNRLRNNIFLKSRRQDLRREQTDAERKLWSHLRNRQLDQQKWYRQYSVGKYVLDFYCPRRHLCIELDGGQHTEDKHERYDRERSMFLGEQGIRVVRFWNNDVLENIEGVIEKIYSPP